MEGNNSNDSVNLAVNLGEGADAPRLNGELAKQVGEQCKAVACMAASIARVYQDYAVFFPSGYGSPLLEPVGKRTSELMELLGDILNNMDAAINDDEWMDPVFQRAQALWPPTSALNVNDVWDAIAEYCWTYHEAMVPVIRPDAEQAYRAAGRALKALIGDRTDHDEVQSGINPNSPQAT